MGDVISLVVVLILGAVLGVETLILVSIRRSVSARKMFYLLLFFYEILWYFLADKVIALVGVPRPWRNGLLGVLVAVMGATIVLLYRHRHDPDPPDPDVP